MGTMGKRKIEIKKIENIERRRVTFSKRRKGLFGKAMELSVLSGAQVVILAFSPAGKPFTSEHPNEEAIIQRYLQENGQPPLPRLEEAGTDNGRGINVNWLDMEIEGMNLEELEKVREALEELKKNVETKNKGSNISNK